MAVAIKETNLEVGVEFLSRCLEDDGYYLKLGTESGREELAARIRAEWAGIEGLLLQRKYIGEEDLDG